MTVPAEYERASAKFEEFLVDARDNAGLWSTHVAYTMVQGVLQTFRRRLSPEQSIAFANVLPICLRALFVTEWDLREGRRAFEDVETMTLEVQALRGDHNFAPDTSIRDVARALRRYVDQEKFDRVLDSLPEGARAFWEV